MYFMHFLLIEECTACSGAVISKARTHTKLAHLEPVSEQKIQRCVNSQCPFRVVGFVHQLLAGILIL